MVNGPWTRAASGFGGAVIFGGTALPGNDGATSSARAEAAKASTKAATFIVNNIFARMRYQWKMFWICDKGRAVPCWNNKGTFEMLCVCR